MTDLKNDKAKFVNTTFFNLYGERYAVVAAADSVGLRVISSTLMCGKAFLP